LADADSSEAESVKGAASLAAEPGKAKPKRKKVAKRVYKAR